MTWYTYGTVAVYDAAPGADDKLITNATGGKLVAVKDGAAIPIRDLNGTPISEITSNSDGQSSQFQAEVLRGLVQFGSVCVTVFANEVGDLLANTSTAVTAAQASATSAAQALSNLQSYIAANPGGGGTGGVTDHGALSGLGDDDHTQYLNTARGDNRYYTQAQVASAISAAVDASSLLDRSRSNHSGTQTSGTISDFLEAVQDVLGSMVQAAGGTYNDTAGSITLPSGGGGSGAKGTEVWFSTLTGTSDDDKLTTWMAAQRAIATGGFHGKTLVLDEERTYSFNAQQELYNGFSITGADRPQDQPRSSLPVGNRVNLGMTGGWFTLPTTPTSIFGVSIQNLSINGTANNRLVDGHASTVLWTSVFRNISVQNCAGVLGSKATQLLLTASSIDGWWNVNNVRERALHFGGSDNRVMPTEYLLDSPPELLADTEYLMGVQSFSKTHFQNFYITAEGHSAISVAGTGDVVTFEKFAIEGRNAGAPCKGALVRVTGNTRVTIRDSWLAYAMTNPSATGRNDAGLVHATAGSVLLDGCVTERATGVAESVPILYASGGKHIVRNLRSMGYTGKPVVFQSASGLIDADSSVELRTAAYAAPGTTANDRASGIANTGTSVTIGRPANTATNDVLIAAVYSRAASAVYTTPPTGWTVVNPTSDITTAGVLRVYYKRVADISTEPASYTWAGGGSGRHVGVMVRAANTGTTVVDAAGAVAAGITGPDRIILPGVTPTTSSVMLVGVATSNGTGGTSPTFTGPTGMDALVSTVTTTGTSESAITLAVQTGQPSGATGTRVMTASAASSTGIGYLVAIQSGNGYTVETPGTSTAVYGP